MTYKNDLCSWPEFPGEEAYEYASSPDWSITFKRSTHCIVCKTASQAHAIANVLKRRPQCGVVSMTHDFDSNVWVITQTIEAAILQEHCATAGEGDGELP